LATIYYLFLGVENKWSTSLSTKLTLCMFFLYLVGRREKELVATVRKAAEAEGYKLERIAEGQRLALLFHQL